MSASETAQPSQPAVDVEELVPRVKLPHTRLSRALDGVVRGAGDLVSWLWVVLILVIVLNVVLRYAFGRGYIAFEEMQWHLYAVGWLFGLSYCVQGDSHIRIDLLHERFKPRTKAWIDFIGILVFLIPYTIVILVYSPQFVEYSWRVNEVSDAPGGLPYRYGIKAFLFVAYVLLLMAAIARLSRCWAALFGGADTRHP